MPSQHKHRPIPFRPAEGDRAWLLSYAGEHDLPVNRVLSTALAEFRIRAELAARDAELSTATIPKRQTEG